MKKEYVTYKGQTQEQMKELQSALLKAEQELKELRVELGMVSKTNLIRTIFGHMYFETF